MPRSLLGELPDLFLAPDGKRLDSPQQWPKQSEYWASLVARVGYGGLPPAPSSVELEPLCRHQLSRWPGAPHHWTYKVHCLGGDRPFNFSIRLLLPKQEAPVPVVINGDGCWWYATETICRKVLERGFGLMLFNRCEMAEDLGSLGPGALKREGGLYGVYPGRSFGAVSAWAWGYHRCVDALAKLPAADLTRLAITGHSRGGKTTLLAGATDSRIAVVNDNAGGAMGAAPIRYLAEGAESLARITSYFPSWFCPELISYVGREQEVPFDQHCLLAAVAPRSLLLTYALGDLWANPAGLVQSAAAAREVFRYLGAQDALAIHLREGAHAHAEEDWEVLLGFLGWRWKGEALRHSFNRHPFGDDEAAFTWRSPGEVDQG